VGKVCARMGVGGGQSWEGFSTPNEVNEDEEGAQTKEEFITLFNSKFFHAYVGDKVVEQLDNAELASRSSIHEFLKSLGYDKPVTAALIIWEHELWMLYQ
jgi:hypothetical protein